VVAESLECPLPPGWKKKQGPRPQKDSATQAGSQAASSQASTSSQTSQTSQTGGGGAESGQVSSAALRKAAAAPRWEHRASGAVLLEHPLNGYFRAIAGVSRSSPFLLFEKKINSLLI